MSILKPNPLSETLPQAEAVLFDWDNTLVNSWPTIHDALNHCFKEMGHEPWSMQEVKARSKLSMRDAFPTLFGDDWERAAKIFQTYHSSIHLERMQPLPEAENMLKALKANGLFVAAVSNKRGPAIRKEVAKIGWESYFDAIIGAGDAEHDKPAPDPAHLALEGKRVSAPNAVWFVGDTVVDLQCGAAIGAVTVYYGDGATDGHLEGVPWHHNITCHTQLTKLLGLAT